MIFALLRADIDMESWLDGSRPGYVHMLWPLSHFVIVTSIIGINTLVIWLLELVARELIAPDVHTSK